MAYTVATLIVTAANAPTSCAIATAISPEGASDLKTKNLENLVQKDDGLILLE